MTAANGNTYQYDSQNELVGMNGGAVRLVYDGDGNRVEKTVNGATTRYLVDDLNPTGYPQVVEETGTTARTYTYGLQRISENQIVNGAMMPSFYGYDGMGSVRQLTNSVGAVTDSYEYDAFGNEISHTGTTPNEMLYRGEQWDSDLGLYYLRARWYNPVTGRFVSRDPNKGLTTDPKTLHKYLYADGDPVDGVDPSGRQDIAAVGLIDLGIAARDAAAVYTAGVAVACELRVVASVLKLAVDPSVDKKTISPDVLSCSATANKKACKPCDPPVSAGDFGYRLDIGQIGDHFDKASKTWIPGGKTHWHLFVCNQTPPDAGCVCSWRKLRDMTGVGVTPPGVDIETTSCSGGGIE